MSFSPTIAHDSKVIPGVRFTVHRMGFGRRAQLDFQTLEDRQRLRELELEYPRQSPKEKELAESLSIAQKKALTVPADQFDAVMGGEVDQLAEQLRGIVTVDTKKQRAALDVEYAAIQARIRVAGIRAGLLSIDGGELDGMTPEQLLDFGPPTLAREVWTALEVDGALDGGASLNFQ